LRLENDIALERAMDASDYYKTRLEHTITHLQQATRLIYFVSGAIVAMLYFVIEKMGQAPAQRYFGIALLVVLGAVNAIHAQIILVQGQWYRALDIRFAQCIGVERPTIGRRYFGSTNLWSILHGLISICAFAAAGFIWWFEAKLSSP